MIDTTRLLSSAGAELRRPMAVFSVLGASAATLLAGVVRLLSGGWFWASVVALGACLLFVLSFALVSLVRRRREQSEQPEPVPGSEHTPTTGGSGASEPHAAAPRLAERFVRGLGVWGRRSAALQLPWYLVIGESGTGKTACLRDSGLELPADTAPLVEQGQTENFSWWPTNQAILLDTAGRYLEREDPETRREWRELLRLIRRHGRKVSLQGVIVALSVRQLAALEESQLRAHAHRLRRRLNEIAADLRVDAPIYVLVTHADAVEGFVEFAKRLPHARRDEALGWTNPERRYSDPRTLLRKGFAPLLERIELLLPGLLVREPDAAMRRRLISFPSELADALSLVGEFVEQVCARSVYGSVPFLRGVYLASALQQGVTHSARLERWGYGFARHSVDEFRPQRALFVRDLFGKIIVDAEEASLAVRARELSTGVRRTLIGVGGMAAVAAVAAMTLSFWNSWTGLERIRSDLLPTTVERPSLETLARLSETLVEVEQPFARSWQRMGLTAPLSHSVERAGSVLASRFEELYEAPTKARMRERAGELDERSFDALSALALDIAWLEQRSGSASSAPDLWRFVECRGCDAVEARACFAQGYSAWRRFAPERAERRIVEQREVLRRATPNLLRLDNVDRWCRAQAEACRDLRYEDFGLVTPERCAPLPGAYTQNVWASSVSQLVDAIRASGQASAVDVERFLRDYRRRYAREWEAFLTCLPLPPAAELPESSAYLRVLEVLASNTTEGSQWSASQPPPQWFGLVQELVRLEPLAEGEVAPGARYAALIEDAAIEVERLRDAPGAALAAARSTLGDVSNPFAVALGWIEKAIPTRPGAEEAVRKQLRGVLEMPFLNGFSTTLAAAAEHLDEQWRNQVVSAQQGASDDLSQLRALYAAPEGALAKFEARWLAGLETEESALPLLRDRGVPLGPAFLRWLRKARAQRAAYFEGKVRSLRFVSKPGSIDGSPNLFVTRRRLRLRCPEGEQVFEHADAGRAREFTFRWTPACDAVFLRLEVQRAGEPVRTLPERAWTGPFALVRFLDASRERGEDREWTYEFGSRLRIRVAYAVSGADEVQRFRHRPPPDSLLR